MDKEKRDNLIKYLNNKGITDIEIDKTWDDYIDIFYSRYDIRLTIRLTFYSSVKYSTLDVSPEYTKNGKYITYYRKKSWRQSGCYVRRYVGGEDINKLRTKFSRVDFNNAVYKNILLIQTWLDPRLEEKKKIKDELKVYASELKFYFEDKYGKVDLNISGGKDRKDITAVVINNEGATETHYMLYEDGKYFLTQIVTTWSWRKEKKVYKQRKKV